MKRNLFNELKEGFTAHESAREGKITLRQQGVEKKPALTITPEELLSLREKLHLSRTVFASYLRTNEANWKAGNKDEPDRIPKLQY
ncbi:MAG: hypothetical protein Q8K74_06360 [Candidatus Nitrotoga sp.]|nr:hypothetical protein [Candidatus Nitrotoga sp.]MDP1855659.1 hypothetical protein [Candidatus Nitrotoga sp.]